MLKVRLTGVRLKDECRAIDRQFADADPGRPRESVRERCRAGDGGWFAHALGPQRSHWRGDLDEAHVDVGHLVGGRQPAVEEAAWAQLSIAVVGYLLAQCPPEPRGGAAPAPRAP